MTARSIELYSPRQVAELVGVDYRTVLRWIREGRLRGQKLGHRTVRIRREELEAFLAGRGVGADR